jgi:hypothetical protein
MVDGREGVKYPPKWPMTPHSVRHKLTTAPIVARVFQGGPSKWGDGTKLAPIKVTLAAYRTFADAFADWDALEHAAQATPSELVDAVLIERTLAEVSKFPVPGGVGTGRCCQRRLRRILVALDSRGCAGWKRGRPCGDRSPGGLSREAIGSVGKVMENGTFVSIAIADRSWAPTAFLGPRAIQIASLPFAATAQALRDALDLDDSED